MNLSTAQLTQIESTCRAHFVAELHLIGSVLREDFTEESDIDLLVEFDVPEEVDYVENYFGLIDKLQTFLNRKIQLVADRPFKNPVFAKQIRKTKVMVYGKNDLLKNLYLENQTNFSIQDHSEKKEHFNTPRARLELCQKMTFRAYGLDPANPPRMDKTAFSIRTRTD